MVDRFQNGAHKKKPRCNGLLSTWKESIKGNLQRRKHRDEEYFNRDLWRKASMSLGRRKLVFPEQFL
jgi:hypothetical protein